MIHLLLQCSLFLHFIHTFVSMPMTCQIFLAYQISMHFCLDVHPIERNNFWFGASKHTYLGQLCHPHHVLSSRVRPLATTAVALLHLARSLVSHIMLLMEGPFMVFILSSHLVLGLPHLPFPLISPSITSFSIPRSSLTTCPKYVKAACATLDSSFHSGLMKNQDC